jgi:PBP1b-binding outer membrane lipoprotein LpoB
LPAPCRNSGAFSIQAACQYSAAGLLMKAFATVLTSALLLAGCSQVIDQFYSKKEFNMQSFQTDISECKKRSPSFVAMRVNAVEPKAEVDDAMVRECMISKGYMVQFETK